MPVGIGMTRVTGRRLEREPRRAIERVATLLVQWDATPAPTRSAEDG